MSEVSVDVLTTNMTGLPLGTAHADVLAERMASHVTSSVEGEGGGVRDHRSNQHNTLKVTPSALAHASNIPANNYDSTESERADVVKADTIKHKQEPTRIAAGGGGGGVMAAKKHVNEVKPTPTPPSGDTTESDDPPGGFSPHVTTSAHASPFLPMTVASGLPSSLPSGDACGVDGDVAGGTTVVSSGAADDTSTPHAPTQARPRGGKRSSQTPPVIINVGKKSPEGQDSRFVLTPLCFQFIINILCNFLRGSGFLLATPTRTFQTTWFTFVLLQRS